MRLVLVQPQLQHVQGRSNLERLRRILLPLASRLETADVVLLPEHHDGRLDAQPYETEMCELARELGCHLVAGTQHRRDADGRIRNSGICVDAHGDVRGRYEKLRPYGAEQAIITPGRGMGELVLEGRRVLVMVCADFWFSDLFQRPEHAPDLVLVPALSVTRKSDPGYSRALWRHMAVARAYELGLYIGISDWAHPSQLPVLKTAGVAGFADPTTTRPEGLFEPLAEREVAFFELGFDALDAFREDRRARGFFWKPCTP